MFVPEECAARLTAWYGSVRRALPWRETKDPYRIWVSEIMLQQTRVETVKGYYARFLERFPDVASLAAAPEQDVLKLWEGLGYYSRARNMQRAARTVALELGGAFPRTARKLLKLPGVGEYTAGAVASIAFGEAAPAVDGNVKRVAARLLGVREPVDGKVAQRNIREALAALLRAGEPGLLNQALMELGATLCLPRAPRCESCPVAALCDARAEGDAESLPVLPPKSPPKPVDVGVCILTFNGEALVVRRAERLLQGLYVFWLLEGETREEALRQSLREAGLCCAPGQALGEAEHIFTHRVWRMRFYHFALEKRPENAWLAGNDARMADALALRALPMPTAMRAARARALALLENSLPEPSAVSVKRAGTRKPKP